MGGAFSPRRLILRIVDYPREQSIDLSIVVPVFNESESLETLFAELKGTVAVLPYEWEIIFVDDGSIDGSFEKLLKIQESCRNVGIVQFRRNFGQTAALSAGFDFAHGDIIITMDADLQNDPADIAALVSKLEEGYDIVSGWRPLRRARCLNPSVPALS